MEKAYKRRWEAGSNELSLNSLHCNKTVQHITKYLSSVYNWIKCRKLVRLYFSASYSDTRYVNVRILQYVYPEPSLIRAVSKYTLFSCNHQQFWQAPQCAMVSEVATHFRQWWSWRWYGGVRTHMLCPIMHTPVNPVTVWGLKGEQTNTSCCPTEEKEQKHIHRKNTLLKKYCHTYRPVCIFRTLSLEP